MTESSYPWLGTSPGDAGPYSAQQWWTLWKNLNFGNRPDSTVLLGSGAVGNDTPLKVQAAGIPNTTVTVKSGAAIVDGTFYISTADASLSIPANASGNPRIDLIILRKDNILQTIRLAVKQGTPAASPVAPSLIQTAGVMWEVELARVTVASAFVSITDSVITQTAEPANVPSGSYLYDVLNNSGGDLVTGDVVVYDTTTNRAVKTTTTRNDSLVAGVWVGFAANGAYGRVQIGGIGLVRVDAAIATRGNLLMTSTTAKSATAYVNGVNDFSPYQVGINLETIAAAGLVMAIIRPQYVTQNSELRQILYCRAYNNTVLSGDWSVSTNGTAASSPQTDANYVNLATGGTINNTTGAGVANFNTIRRQYNPTLTFLLRFPTLTTSFRLWLGLTSLSFTNVDVHAGSCIALRYSTVAGDAGIVPVVRDGVTQQVGAVLVAPTAVDPYLFKIRVDDGAGIAYFSVNLGAEIAMSVNLPASTTNLGWDLQLITLAAANKAFQFSWMRIVLPGAY